MIDGKTTEQLSKTLCYGESYEKKQVFLRKFWESKPQYFLNFVASEKFFREQYGINICMTFNRNVDKITAVIVMKDGVLYVQDIIIPYNKYTTMAYIQRSSAKFLLDLYGARLKVFLSSEIGVSGSIIGILTPHDKYVYKTTETPTFKIGSYYICKNSVIILYGERFTLGTANNGTWEEISCLAKDVILVQRFITNHCTDEVRDIYSVFK